MLPEIDNLSLAARRAEIARLARQKQRLGDDPQISAKITERTSAYKEAKLAEYIHKLVDAAPPFSAEQRDRLALLLRGDR